MLTVKESKLVQTLSNLSFGNAEAMHMAGYKAVSKAYGDTEDKGELARACLDALRVKDKPEFAKFLRKYGMNVVIDKRIITVGGVLNLKNADKHVRAAKEDIQFFQLVEAHVKPAPVKKPEERVASQIADDLIQSLITRQKDENVRGYLQQRIQRPAWFAKLAVLELSDDEVAAIVEAVNAMREGDEVTMRKAA